MPDIYRDGLDERLIRPRPDVVDLLDIYPTPWRGKRHGGLRMMRTVLCNHTDIEDFIAAKQQTGRATSTSPSWPQARSSDGHFARQLSRPARYSV